MHQFSSLSLPGLCLVCHLLCILILNSHSYNYGSGSFSSFYMMDNRLTARKGEISSVQSTHSDNPHTPYNSSISFLSFFLFSFLVSFHPFLFFILKHSFCSFFSMYFASTSPVSALVKADQISPCQRGIILLYSSIYLYHSHLSRGIIHLFIYLLYSSAVTPLIARLP